ncbi:MAG: acyl-CoA dehydratase activase-related protein [Puniceicoccales bacterium]|jgi:predicted CoA-substrate-specific enzyme activase|nr:acyl-CoA dehydratase activase-related protein [Puniceicoccales bacterium]
MVAINETIPYSAGLDVGSTTIKLVIVDPRNGKIVFSEYRRHNTDIAGGLKAAFAQARDILGNDAKIALAVTGSAGMGLSEMHGIPFLQEVVAAAEVVNQRHPDIRVLVDIGGEDAKMIFFTPGMAPDIRMNGSCAGGTGAFIDQVATLLGCDVSEMEALAREAKTVHPIASRCGVFAKTDIQNLLSRNVSRADIAASVFHAVAIQVVTTLARGRDILPKLMLCGGPLSFIPTLGAACRKTMGIDDADCAIPDNAALVPALGCAIIADHDRLVTGIDELLERFARPHPAHLLVQGAKLSELFSDAADYEAWKQEKQQNALPRASLEDLSNGTCFLGIDSGSTTTKIVAIDDNENVLFTFYQKNSGNPLATVLEGLTLFQNEAVAAGCADLRIAGAAVTGYGEDLIKAAFDFDIGLVETIAHYLAAHKINPEVSFILDIGGQDMKATFIKNGAIVRLDINEACSSGCGSFLESFANSLQRSAGEFAASACTSLNPCDLGTRCTVFMNSKVKQSLREGSPLQDIAAGLAYSVVKNCLYKVLKLKNPAEFGAHIVVQGGTMRNHAVVRALEKLTEREVRFTDMPELMGAYGAALHVCRNGTVTATRQPRLLASLTQLAEAVTDETTCPGCENRCQVRQYTFANTNTFYSGNKCEKIYTNRGADFRKGENIYPFKYSKIFRQTSMVTGEETADPKLRIGIPRALNYYENYPFWHKLLSAAGAEVVLSTRSTFKLYEKGARTIMSDNICFPAKLVHGHIYDLIERKVDRILMPFVLYEMREDAKAANTFNCPVVTGYSDVVRSAIDPEGRHNIPLDAPSINFQDILLLERACRSYIVDTLGLSGKKFTAAFTAAVEAQKQHARDLKEKAKTIAEKAIADKRLLILLSGRPYHTDPLIQHKIADMIAAFGVDVISEDIVRGDGDVEDASDGGTVRQWSYTNRILKSARWVAQAPDNVYLVQLTSFGCGPDAFIADDVGDILNRAGKSHTLLKVDDINNIGSLRLRIRSLIESLEYRRVSSEAEQARRIAPPVTTPPFTDADNHRTILAPFFSEIYSPFVPILGKLMGYNLVNLPPANETSIDYGLKNANNEICYPATLVVGDFIQALKSGKYDTKKVVIGITQTGGQCRASNYIALIKKALVANGYTDVPVISVASLEDDLVNEQPGFKLKWQGVLRHIVTAMLYADRIAQMYNASAPRERISGSAVRLRDDYINAGVASIAGNDIGKLYKLLARAAADFNDILDPAKNQVPRVGIVGEIYVKYNSTGNKNIVEWLIGQGIEPVVPALVSFFLQIFPNRRINIKQHLMRRSGIPFLDTIAYAVVRYYMKKFDRVASAFRFHHPFSDIYTDAERAAPAINLAAQYGEGWLIPAELASFAERGIYNAISLQPFGCIANHLVAKGVENRIRKLYPKMNLLFLDLDSGASEANIMNRLHFMIQNARNGSSPKERSNGALEVTKILGEVIV